MKFGLRKVSPELPLATLMAIVFCPLTKVPVAAILVHTSVLEKKYKPLGML
jgi:hypothetical protein